MATDTGITVYNIWRDAAGAAAYTRQAEVQQAQSTSGLPDLSSITRYPDAQVTPYDQPRPEHP